MPQPEKLKKNIQEFIMGGLIIYHNLTLIQKIWPFKKIANVFGNQLKVANYAGCQNKFIVKYLAHFLPFLKAQETNWYHILKSVLKVGKIMWAWNCVFFFQSKCNGNMKKS